ncbi:MAG: type II toxin-antitoxin system VapC family toxin [Spirochaetes bacterium]|nr:type II toxin-antitoxin system VapC family toxin [Spirochaetota bacterium]
MIFDTDVLIWIQRGNLQAAETVESERDRYISILTYMELLQCASNKEQHRYTKSFLKDFNFSTLPLTENIGHRALIYIEEYTLSGSLRAGDAIIAATAIENNLVLSSGNSKHFKQIKDLKLKVFKP